MVFLLKGLEFHKGMSLHICCINIGIQMSVFIGVFSLAMAEHMLGDGGAGDAVKMGSGGVSEKMCVEGFVNGEGICNAAKDILQGSLRYTFAPF